MMRTRDEIATVSADAPIRRVVDVMAAAAVESVLVLDERGRVVGSVADDQLVARARRFLNRPWWRDLLTADGEPGKDDGLFYMTAGEIMLKRVVPVTPALSAESAITILDEEAVNVLPVVYAGRLVGALFRRDLVRRVLQPLSGAPDT